MKAIARTRVIAHALLHLRPGAGLTRLTVPAPPTLTLEEQWRFVDLPQFSLNGDMCRMADPTFEPYGGVAPRWAGSRGAHARKT